MVYVLNVPFNFDILIAQKYSILDLVRIAKLERGLSVYSLIEGIANVYMERDANISHTRRILKICILVKTSILLHFFRC